MSFLKDWGVPAPLVDVLLPIVVLLIIAMIVVPRITLRLKTSGVWDRIVDRVGGEKYRLMQFEREISALTKAGDFVGAARLYEEAEWFPEAINLYIEAEDYISAANLYEQLEQWDRAADMYMKSDDWKQASNMMARAGKAGEAARLFEENGQKIDAAKLYFDAGVYDRAARLYQDVSYFPQAAKCFEKLGEDIKAAENYEQHWTATTSVGGSGLIASPSDREAKIALRAGKLYEKGGAAERAATLYKRAGLAKEAADLAARMGNFKEAAEMLLKEEELEKAAEMFRKAGNHQRAALLEGEVAFHQGDNSTAAEKFLKGGDNLRAAELYESVGNLRSAAECYEQSDAPIQAANVYLRAQEKAKAAEMFERGNDFETAARLFEEVGDKAKASVLYEQCGRFFEAGKLAQERGDGGRAIQLLQQLDASHENYSSAMLILSRLFLEKDMPGLAIDKLKRLLGNQQINSQTLEHYYCLGQAYEKHGNTEEAIRTFRKIMAERYGYEDVEQRIARLSGATGPGPVAPTPQPSQPAMPAAPAPAPSTPPPSSPTVAIATGSPRSAVQVPATAVAARAQAPSAAPPPPTPAAAAPPPQPQPAAQPAAPAPAPTPKAAPASPIQLAEELGKGLLGTTYKGIDTRTQSPVTVKLLREDLLRDPAVVQQFLAEAKIARQLDHPSLVRLLGLVEIDGAKAAVTEYVEGFDLGSFLARTNRISLKQALDLLKTLCAAIGYAHERRLLHHDLKPTNVIVGKGGKLKLTGFGLGALRTRQLGKADGYPSPEFLGGAAIDQRSDIYSLGALLFHAISGRHPESGELAQNGEPPRLRQLVPDAPVVLEQILDRCLAKDPARRFSGMAEALAAAQTLQV